MENVFFILTSVFFYIVFFDFKKTINIFRFFGVFFSICMIFMFNFNWLFSLPVKLNYFSLLILIISLIGLFLRQKDNFFEKIKFSNSFSRGLFFIILSSFFLVFISNLYFQGKWNEPRYDSPDSGGHYLYMSRTSDSGFLPLFMPNVIYEATGQNDTFLHHHDTHFPGSSAVFYIFNKILGIDRVALLQVFNVSFFILTALYLFFILYERKVFKTVYFWLIVLIFIFFGNLFSLVIASYTNQLFGLFFLLTCIDYFEYFKKTKNWFFLSIITSGLIIAYFYWLPVVILFALFSFISFEKLLKTKFSFKENKKAYLVFFSFMIALVLSGGYIIKTIQAGTIGYIDAGSFNFDGKFINDFKIILIFSLFNLYLFLKQKIKQKENYFFINFSFAVLGYSLILMILFFLKIAGNYSMNKSFFLTTPFIWIIGMEFFEKVINKLNFEKIKSFPARIKEIFIRIIKFPAQFIGATFVLIIVLALFKEVIFDFNLKKFKIYPKLSNNLDDIFKNKEKDSNASREILDFVAKIKKDYSFAIKDKRILMISSIDDSLWIFATSGIWPRPLSVMPVGVENYGIYSPMSFYSRKIVDYRQWLFNDKDHYIIVFNSSASKKWIKNSGFDINDYDTIFSDEYGNKLLKLKKGVSTKFIYDEDLDLRHDYVHKGWSNNDSIKEVIPVPVSGEIISKYNNLSGLFLDVDIKEKEKKNIKSDYLFKLKSGECQDVKDVMFERIISKEEIKNIPTRKDLKIFFEKPIIDSENKIFCLEFSRVNKFSDYKNETLNLVFKNKNINYTGIYNYTNE